MPKQYDSEVKWLNLISDCFHREGMMQPSSADTRVHVRNLNQRHSVLHDKDQLPKARSRLIVRLLLLPPHCLPRNSIKLPPTLSSSLVVFLDISIDTHSY